MYTMKQSTMNNPLRTFPTCDFSVETAYLNTLDILVNMKNDKETF